MKLEEVPRSQLASGMLLLETKASMDWHACDLKTLDKKLLADIMAIFPEKIQKNIRELCRI